jgi:hypothetical protein
VSRAAGKTATAQENVKEGLELGEDDLGFQLLTEEVTTAVIFFIYFHQH